MIGIFTVHHGTFAVDFTPFEVDVSKAMGSSRLAGGTHARDAGGLSTVLRALVVRSGIAHRETQLADLMSIPELSTLVLEHRAVRRVAYAEVHKIIGAQNRA